MELDIPPRATIVDLITSVLNKKGLSGSADNYEMFLAEEDGAPDDDLPKPSRNQPVSDFRDCEFALRRIVGDSEVKPAPIDVAGSSISSYPTESPTPIGFPLLGLVCVKLPQQTLMNSTDSIKLKTSPGIKLSDILKEVCRKQNVNLDPSKHVLYGDLAGRCIELDTTCTLDSLHLTCGAQGHPVLELRPRTFADAPWRHDRMQSEVSTRSSINGEQVEFVFSEISASRYKEFNVIKLNKRGVRQERVLGIDGQRLYNARAHTEDDIATGLREWGLRTLGLRGAGDHATKHPSHLIRDILEARLGADPGEFTLVIRDPLELSRPKEYRYETRNNVRDANEIVARLKYLMRGGGHRSTRISRNHIAATDYALGPRRVSIGHRL